VSQNTDYACLDCDFGTNSEAAMNDHINEAHNEGYGQQSTDYEWGVRWPNDVVMVCLGKKEADRSARLGGGAVVRREVGPWLDPTQIDRSGNG
jgi:hypothetical protein